MSQEKSVAQSIQKWRRLHWLHRCVPVSAGRVRAQAAPLKVRLASLLQSSEPVTSLIGVPLINCVAQAVQLRDAVFLLTAYPVCAALSPGESELQYGRET